MDLPRFVMPIADHITIQYLIVQKVAFSLISGLWKWSSSILVPFTSVSLLGNVAEDYTTSSEFSISKQQALSKGNIEFRDSPTRNLLKSNSYMKHYCKTNRSKRISINIFVLL
jgi:hypothetical protein